jgi:GNAT superfamily N-acetyltransferase
VDPEIAIGLLIAIAAAITLNWAYVQEHGAASGMPPLSLRHPVRSVKLLFSSREWLKGLAGEVTGFALYVVALALAPLSLVQSMSAGGIAVLAYLSARSQGRSPSSRERLGVGVSLAGLAALGVSLAGSTGDESHGSFPAVSAWLGASAIVVLVCLLSSKRIGKGVAYAMAAGTLLAAGDISVKTAFEGGWHFVFLATAAAGYGIGTILLQIAYQHARALTAAGIATLLTNALPIVAATTILGEDIPSGVLGAVRVFSFAAVIGGAVLLARGTPEAASPPRAVTVSGDERDAAEASARS